MLDKRPKLSFSNVFYITNMRRKWMLNMMWFRFCVVRCIYFVFLVHFDYWACSISKTSMFNHLCYYMIIPKHLWVWYLFKFWASRMSKWPFYLERVELLIEEIITVGNKFWTRDIFNWFYKHRMSKHLACLSFFFNCASKIRFMENNIFWVLKFVDIFS